MMLDQNASILRIGEHHGESAQSVPTDYNTKIIE